MSHRYHNFQTGVRESESKAANFCMKCLKDRMIGAFKIDAVNKAGLLEETLEEQIKEIGQRATVNGLSQG